MNNFSNQIKNIKKYFPTYIILALLIATVSYFIIDVFGIYAYMIAISLLLANLWTDIGDALPSHVQMLLSTKFVHLSANIARLIKLMIKSLIKMIYKNCKKIGKNIINFVKHHKEND